MLAVAASAQPLPNVKSVIIFGVDGLGANVVRSSAPPSFLSFQQEFCFSLHARGVMPTVTFPNFGSMVSGAGPEQHGITSNDWRPNRFDIAPTCQGRGGHFPTVFGLMRDQKPDANWPHIVALAESGPNWSAIVRQPTYRPLHWPLNDRPAQFLHPPTNVRLLAFGIKLRCDMMTGWLVYRGGINNSHFDLIADFQVGTGPLKLFFGGADQTADCDM